MSVPIITRALLEHYLRATGWRHRSSFHGWREWDFQKWTAMVPETGEISAETLRAVGWPLKIKGGEVGARLGMCVAAEMAIADAATWEPSNPEIDNDGTEHEVLTNLGRNLLKAAGVDPRRWEEARHG
jgi:hypothetical protein